MAPRHGDDAVAIGARTKSPGSSVRRRGREEPDLRLIFPVRHNLPLVVTCFVGRDDERAELSRLISDSSLVTVVGPAGVGKSRLAVEVAAQALEYFIDGSWFVDMAVVTEPGLVLSTLADAVGIDNNEHLPVEDALLERLCDRRVLLVLDNCEHASGAVAATVGPLLGACPDLRIVATSRAPLRVAGEQVWRLEPLRICEPEVGEDAGSTPCCPAVVLFCDRAARRRHGFSLTPEIAESVHRICRRLDGLPLGIELAADRVGALAPSEILERLDDRFELLGEGDGPDPDRHGSLRASLDWGHGLLTASEATLFRRLAVFEGGWCLPAAEQVCAAGDIAPQQVARLLAGLVDKSLVVADMSATATRFRFLRTVHAHARLHLAAAGEEEAVTERHGDWCLALAEATEPQLRLPTRAQGFARLSAEHENLMTALDRMLGADRHDHALRTATAVAVYWRERRPLEEGREWLTKVVSLPDQPARARAKALFRLAELEGEAAGHAEALPLLQQSRRLAERAGDHWVTAQALVHEGYYRWLEGECDPARALLERGEVYARRSHDDRCIQTALATLGHVAMFAGDARRARAHFGDALAVGAGLGDDEHTWTALVGLGWAALVRGAYDEARVHLDEVLVIGRGTDSEQPVGVALNFLGEVARAQGRYRLAHERLAEALASARPSGCPFRVASRLNSMGRLHCAEGDLESALRCFEGAAVAGQARLTLVLAQSLWERAPCGWLVGTRPRRSGSSRRPWRRVGRAVTGVARRRAWLSSPACMGRPTGTRRPFRRCSTPWRPTTTSATSPVCWTPWRPWPACG